MSATSDINAINLAFSAETAAAADRAAGTYDSNLADNPYYYTWQGDQQILPSAMAGDPEGFAQGLRAALPAVNTLRLSFNAFSFDAAGNLHPEYERFLAEAARQGFRLLMTYTDGEIQRLGSGGTLAAEAIEAELRSGDVITRASAAFDRLFDWMDRHSGVARAVWGYELANEPAAYERVVDFSPRGTKGAAEARMVELYARHMADLADQVAERAPEARILVGGWGFSGRFHELADNMIGTVSAADYLRGRIGDALVWSAHAYPGWHPGTDATDPAAVRVALQAAYAPVLADDILLTETNLFGANINYFTTAPSAVSAFARVQEWWTEQGIGITWSPGAQAGGSSLVTVDPGAQLRFLHQHSYAFAMNAFSLDDRDPAHAGDETLHAKVIAGRLRNEETDPDYNPAARFDPVNGLGTAFGHDGNDTLSGADMANNFLYGGRGMDLLRGAAAEDFLFGQYGNDILLGHAGADLLFGGVGADLLRGGTGADTLEGGAGADRFDARAGNDVITDFGPGDLLHLGRGYTGWQQVAARITLAAVNGPAINDVVIRHADGSRTTLIDAKGLIGAAQLVFAGQADWVEGTAQADTIGSGWQDFDGQSVGQVRRISAAGGNDVVAGTTAADTLDGGTGHDRLDAGTGRDLLLGGAGNDLLRAGDHADTLMGGWGDDRLFGGAGHDVLNAGAGRDTLFGEDGDDSLTLGAGGGLASGGLGKDRPHAGSGAATLWGGAGDDLLIANLSQTGHRLAGHGGADTFVLHSAASGGRSLTVIEDFGRADRLIFEGQRLLPDSASGARSGNDLVMVLEPGHRLLLEDWFA
jgi:Ca2+-binding RTX toxin-like protein